MLAAVDVGAVAGIAGIVIGASGLVLSIIALVQSRAANRQAVAIAARAEETALASVEWGLYCKLRPPSQESGRPALPPVELSVRGANVWVHQVIARWGKPLTLEPPQGGGYCWDYEGPHALPAMVNSSGPPLLLSLPPEVPLEPTDVPFDISVVWSLAFDGPQQLRTALITEISWQEATESDLD